MLQQQSGSPTYHFDNHGIEYKEYDRTTLIGVFETGVDEEGIPTYDLGIIVGNPDEISAAVLFGGFKIVYHAELKELLEKINSFDVLGEVRDQN